MGGDAHDMPPMVNMRSFAATRDLKNEKGLASGKLTAILVGGSKPSEKI